MNATTPLALLGIGLLTLATTAATPDSGPTEPAGEPARAESRVTHATNGDVTVTLDPQTEERVGVRLVALVATNLPPEIKGYARVLDPAPLIALVADRAPAEAVAQVSWKEFERLQAMRSQGNASDRSVEAAEAVALRDRAALESLRSRLVLGWGERIANVEHLSMHAIALAELREVLVRIDLPAGDTLPGQPTRARLVPPFPGAVPIPAEFVSLATSTDPQFQGQGFLFLARDPRLTPGAATVGFIETDGEPVRGLLVPAAAVIRHAGRNWVWVRTTDHAFARREVTLGRSSGGGYLVRAGFLAGDRVVVTGGAQLLSEELKGQAAEE